MDLKDFLINRTQVPTLKSGMDAYSLRQKTIANNIANVETKGYKRKEVVFEEEFRKALNTKTKALTRTDPRHLPVGHNTMNIPSEVKVVQDKFSNGINNVDMDKEMSLLAKTQLDYNAMTKLATKQLKLLKSAINGR